MPRDNFDEGVNKRSLQKPLSSQVEIRELKQGRPQRQRRRQKTMIWLVEWGQIIVLHVQMSALTTRTGLIFTFLLLTLVFCSCSKPHISWGRFMVRVYTIWSVRGMYSISSYSLQHLLFVASKSKKGHNSCRHWPHWHALKMSVVASKTKYVTGCVSALVLGIFLFPPSLPCDWLVAS